MLSYEELQRENEQLKKERDTLTAKLQDFTNGSKDSYRHDKQSKNTYSYYYDEEQRSK